MKLILVKFIFILFILGHLSACLKSTHKSGDAPPGPPPPPAPVQKNTADYKPRMTDRYYIRSVFKSVFMSESQNESGEASIGSLIDQRIFANSNYFGGPCRYLDPSSCRTNAINSDLESPMIPTSSVPREGLRVGLCLDLTEGSATRNRALTKANITNFSITPTDQNFASIYQLFYPGRNLSAVRLNNLKTVYVSAKSTGSDINKALGIVLYAVCLSPEWQIL